MPDTITLTGKLTRSNGEPSRGFLVFQLTAPLVDAANNLIASRALIRVDLDSNGSFSVELVPTNDPTHEPSNVTYLVTEHMQGDGAPKRSYNIAIPHDATGGTIDLADLIPADAPEALTYAVVQGVTQGDFENHSARHESGGADVLNVAGLSGVLADPQTPAVHDNAAHDPDMATAAELTTHTGASTSVHGIADTSDLETETGAQSKVDTHSDLDTGVHGVGVSTVESASGAQAKADAAESAANTYTDTEVSTHDGSADDVHGIPSVPVGGIIRRTAGGWAAVEGDDGTVLRRESGVWAPDTEWRRGIQTITFNNRWHWTTFADPTSNGKLFGDGGRFYAAPFAVDMPHRVSHVSLDVIEDVTPLTVRFGIYVPNFDLSRYDLVAGSEIAADGSGAPLLEVEYDPPLAIHAPVMFIGAVLQDGDADIKRVLGSRLTRNAGSTTFTIGSLLRTDPGADSSTDTLAETIPFPGIAGGFAPDIAYRRVAL